MGFGVPLKEWLRGDMKHIVLKEFNDKSNDIFEFISFNEVQVAQERLFNYNTSQNLVWALLMLSYWIKNVHNK